MTVPYISLLPGQATGTTRTTERGAAMAEWSNVLGRTVRKASLRNSVPVFREEASHPLASVKNSSNRDNASSVNINIVIVVPSISIFPTLKLHSAAIVEGRGAGRE